MLNGTWSEWFCNNLLENQKDSLVENIIFGFQIECLVFSIILIIVQPSLTKNKYFFNEIVNNFKDFYQSTFESAMSYLKSSLKSFFITFKLQSNHVFNNEEWRVLDNTNYSLTYQVCHICETIKFLWRFPVETNRISFN